MQTPLDKLRAALPHPLKKDGSGYRTRCPGPGHAHGNRSNPALSVTEAAGGTLLLNCHGGCDNADVLASINLTFSDLYADDSRRNGEQEKPDWNPFKCMGRRHR